MRVIFADHDPIARALLSDVLEDLRHESVGFADGEQAWMAYQAEPAPLVVLELRLPRMDALELCRRIRAHDAGPGTFILVVTAQDDPHGLTAVLDAGADDYMSRPSSPKSLRARIEIAERRRRQTNALRTAETELAQARWLAGIGETALAMEREISGPLHTILEKSSELLQDASFNDDQRDQLRIISEQGARLAGVIGRAVNLESPHSVEYLGGARMIDLSGEHRVPHPATRWPTQKESEGEHATDQEMDEK